MKLDTRKATPARNVEFERASLIALLKAVAKGNRKLHNISAAGITNRTSTTGRSCRSRCKLWNYDKVNTHFADDLRNRARAVLKATSAGDVQQTVCKLVNRNRVSPYKQRVNYRRDRTINQHRNVSKNLFRRSRQSRARTPLRSCLRHGSTGLVDNAFVALASVTDNRNALSELFRLATCCAGLEVR